MSPSRRFPSRPLGRAPRHRRPSWRRILPLALLAPVALLLLGLVALPVASTPGRAAAATTPSATTVKPPVRGLLDRQRYPRSSVLPAIHAFVVNVPWSALQPTSNGPIVRPNAIDTALAKAKAAGMTVKLRVSGGIDAPAWVKSLGGAPVTMYYTSNNLKSAGAVAGTVPRFWTKPVMDAYAGLQAKLAAIYDSVPQVGEVTVSGCSTIYNETYLRNAMDPRNVHNLLGAGFTRTADEACHEAQLRAHLVWKATRSGVAFNAYQSIDASGRVRPDLAYTLSQMTECRTVLGARCVLENFSLSSSRLSDPTYQAIYRQMQTLGAPFAFQTASAARIGDYRSVLDYAVRVGAENVELPYGYQSWPLATLKHYDSVLRAG